MKFKFVCNGDNTQSSIADILQARNNATPLPQGSVTICRRHLTQTIAYIKELETKLNLVNNQITH